MACSYREQIILPHETSNTTLFVAPMTLTKAWSMYLTRSHQREAAEKVDMGVWPYAVEGWLGTAATSI